MALECSTTHYLYEIKNRRCGIVTAALTAPLVVQQQTLAELRQEKARLQQIDLPLIANTQPQAGKPAADDLAQLRRDREELLRLQAEAARLRATIDPALQVQLADLQRNLAGTRAAANQIEVEMQSMQLREDTISALKQLGLAARIYATDNGDRLPPNFDVLKDILGPTLPGHLDLDRLNL